MEKVAIIIGLLLVLSAGNALAMGQQGCGGDCVACHSLTIKEASELLKDVGTVKSVKTDRVRGLYELALEKDGKQGTAFMDYAKKHLIAGQVFDLATASTPSPAPVPKLEKVEISKIPLENSLVMGNLKGTKKLFVFTDPECPFCSKMHGELKKLVALEPGLVVYIKMFPLKMHPNAYDKARVIVGKKSIELLDKAFAGGVLPTPDPEDSKKAIDDTIKFAESIGINATPTLILPDGRIMAGFRDAANIRKLISGE